MAELFTRVWSGSDGRVSVSSAGTQALIGQAIDGPSASALARWGIDPSAHRARQFEPRMASDADLVLVAERAHRDLVMTSVPRAFRRTFTIREFARLARHMKADEPARLVARAAQVRGIDGTVGLDGDDIPDPYLGSLSRAVETARLTSDAVWAALSRLGLLAVTDPPIPAGRTRPRPDLHAPRARPAPTPRSPNLQPRPSTGTVPR